LFGEIDPAVFSVKVKAVKVEIKLKKAEAIQWRSFEKSQTAAPVVTMQSAGWYLAPVGLSQTVLSQRVQRQSVRRW